MVDSGNVQLTVSRILRMKIIKTKTKKQKSRYRYCLSETGMGGGGRGREGRGYSLHFRRGVCREGYKTLSLSKGSIYFLRPKNEK